jgi:hypothetical protein
MNVFKEVQSSQRTNDEKTKVKCTYQCRAANMSDTYCSTDPDHDKRACRHQTSQRVTRE